MKRLLYTLAMMFATLQAFAQGTVKYEYDGMNRLTQVIYSNGVVVSYTYDALGNRIGKTVTGSIEPTMAYVWLSNDGKTLTFYYDDKRSERDGLTYDLNSKDNYPEWNPDPANKPCDVTSVTIDPSFINARPTSTFSWFDRFGKLKTITGLEYLNTSDVSEMSNMFAGCDCLEAIDVSHFNTSKVERMFSMFWRCREVRSLDVSKFDTSNVTDMDAMFCLCGYLTDIDLSNFNTSKVKSMENMFSGCGFESLDLRNFDTSNVENMSFMFADCTNLTNLNVSSFNTTKVKNFYAMFYNCSKLKNLDVSNFDVSSGTSYYIHVDELFNKCSSLQQLKISSSMSDLSSNACKDVGTVGNPCTLIAPKGFNFGVDIAGPSFEWNGGHFILLNYESIESIKISSAKQVTYMSDKNLDFTDYPDLKAYVATGYDKSSGTIWLTRVKEVPAMTGFLLMAEANTYEIPVKAGDAVSYYQNLFKGTIEGTTIYTTDGSNTNYYLSNGSNGVGFYKVTKEEGQAIGANRAYLSVPTEIPPVGSEGGTETISVSAAGQVPYYNSESLDFTSMDALGVKAYTATGYDYKSGTIWLTRVKQVPAETGILIMAPEGSYPVPTASVASVYANMFRGTLTGTTIQTHETIAGEDYINYYLSNGNSGVGFYRVTKEEGVTIGANRCYLPIKNKDAVAGTRSMSDDVFFSKMIISNDDDDVIAIPVFGEGTTGIISTQFQNANQDVYYNLQGQRVDNPGKGLYIKNGRKVVIK